MNLRARLQVSREKPLLGAFLGLAVPALVETIGRAGCDYVILDGEHGTFAPDRLEDCLRAATAVNLPALVRVPEASPSLIQAALDAGACGVQVPSVESADQARRIVGATRFAPGGQRGFGSSTRASGYGFTPRPHVLRIAANDTTVVLQIESRKGLENLDDIATVEGVDLLFFGTSDLSLDLGLDSPTHPGMLPVLRDAVAVARRHGRNCAVHAADPMIVGPMRALGVGCFTTAYLSIVAHALQAAVGEFGREMSRREGRS